MILPFSAYFFVFFNMQAGKQFPGIFTDIKKAGHCIHRQCFTKASWSGNQIDLKRFSQQFCYDFCFINIIISFCTDFFKADNSQRKHNITHILHALPFRSMPSGCKYTTIYPLSFLRVYHGIAGLSSGADVRACPDCCQSNPRRNNTSFKHIYIFFFLRNSIFTSSHTVPFFFVHTLFPSFTIYSAQNSPISPGSARQKSFFITQKSAFFPTSSVPLSFSSPSILAGSRV